MWPEPPASPPAPTHHLRTLTARRHLARALARDFDHAQIAALLDHHHAVIDGVLLHEPEHTIEHAVGFASCLSGLHPVGALTGTVLFSVVADAEVARDEDLARWRAMRELEGFLPPIADWLITDGTTICSMRASTGGMDP